jgi:hypothetical protein
MATAADFWAAREASWTYLQEKHPSRVAVLFRLFELIDACVDEYEAESARDTYARICGLTLLKAKNLAIGSLSLLLDALGQEAGALLRPFIEYTELLTYFRHFPEAVEKAPDNDLPKAGQRAKAIGGIYQGFREHLNEHASHSSYSHYSLSHLLTPSFEFRKVQTFAPQVLDKNFTDLTLQIWLLLHEAVLGLELIQSPKLRELARAGDGLKGRMLHVFNLDAI